MGVYELFVPGAQKGQMYKFIIVTEQGDKLYKADPYANYAELSSGNGVNHHRYRALHMD